MLIKSHQVVSDLAGTSLNPEQANWTSVERTRDGLDIGPGQPDRLRDLKFRTQTTHPRRHFMYPTFAVLVDMSPSTPVRAHPLSTAAVSEDSREAAITPRRQGGSG